MLNRERFGHPTTVWQKFGWAMLEWPVCSNLLVLAQLYALFGAEVVEESGKSRGRVEEESRKSRGRVEEESRKSRGRVEEESRKSRGRVEEESRKSRVRTANWKSQELKARTATWRNFATSVANLGSHVALGDFNKLSARFRPSLGLL